MVLAIEIPEKVIERAQAMGIPVEAYVAHALNGIGNEPVPVGFARLGASSKTPAEATAAIRSIASSHTLEGIPVKELLEEGRR